MNLPSKDSAVVRAVRVFVFTLLGFLVTLFAMPEFADTVKDFYPQAVPVLSSVAGILSLVYNILRKDVKNYN